MSNFNKFVKKGGKKDAPAEPAAPKPVAAAPLVDAVDPARTRQVDCSQAAKADADQAQEDEVTVEVPGKAPALYPKSPPKPVPSDSSPGTVVPISAARKPLEEAEADALAESIASDARESPKPPASAEKTFDASALLEKIKVTVSGLLQPLVERIAKLEGDVEELGEMMKDMGTVIDGPSPDAPEEEKVDSEGKPVVGLSGQVAAVKTALDELRTQLLGKDADETLAIFEGDPVVPQILEQLNVTATQVNEVVGKDGERIPSIVGSITRLTAKTLVIELMKPEVDSAKIRQAAIEGGPDTSRDILNALATNEEYAVEIIGALKLAPAESLDDPANARLKAEVHSDAQSIVPRAQYYFQNLDWDKMEADAAEYRAPASEPEQTGGDE